MYKYRYNYSEVDATILDDAQGQKDLIYDLVNKDHYLITGETMRKISNDIRGLHYSNKILGLSLLGIGTYGLCKLCDKYSDNEKYKAIRAKGKAKYNEIINSFKKKEIVETVEQVETENEAE